MSWMMPAIRERRALLAARFGGRLEHIALELEQHFHDPDRLDAMLAEALPDLAPANMVYVVDRRGRQLSANISPAGRDLGKRGQDLSFRPYLRTASAAKMLLSQVVAQLNLPIRIEAGETVRAADGLALSSRNGYLTDAERREAHRLHQNLKRLDDRGGGQRGKIDFVHYQPQQRIPPVWGLHPPLRQAVL